MCFSNLMVLIVDGCQFLSDVLPSHLLPFLTKLERLEVRDCSSVKTIFDVKCITEDRKMKTMEPALLPLPFSLKKLILEQLPNLENVWNEDPHGFLKVQLLQEVVVKNCKCLTSLFPASVAKDLVKLENLFVKHCEGLMVIVAEDNADPKGTNLELTFPCMIESPDDKIIFGELQTLNLEYLPNLTSFYNGSFSLSFPSLEELSVFNCHRMETFCPGTINADKLLRVKFEENSDAIPLEIDLNSTIRKAFLATAESREEKEIDGKVSDEKE
ncbi:uncharacterized protein LOC133295147 [Gastrolobium bilobum]|uniref:uncharacterized protein LOC133295147 n=1 Tax=Gastrolobium bilobum TaxID=150636 RepID=UPI002AB03F6C|nr:uncharacterized protein LOC133295147 [Gastrolobium bilobum]